MIWTRLLVQQPFRRDWMGMLTEPRVVLLKAFFFLVTVTSMLSLEVKQETG